MQFAAQSSNMTAGGCPDAQPSDMQGQITGALLCMTALDNAQRRQAEAFME